MPENDDETNRYNRDDGRCIKQELIWLMRNEIWNCNPRKNPDRKKLN